MRLALPRWSSIFDSESWGTVSSVPSFRRIERP